MAAAVAWVRAAILAATLLGITAAPTRADCNPADRISAQCYPDLQTATAAALAANQPLWLPAGTYEVTHTLFIDYTPQARVGFTIISDGAIIDGRAMHQPVVQIECASDCFYFHLVGTLTVWADVSDAAFQIGKLDFSDPHNSAKIDHLIVNNSDPWGIREDTLLTMLILQARYARINQRVYSI